MAIRKGVSALEDSINKARSGGGPRTEFLGWKDGETKVIRFLTDVDDIFVADVHDWVPCADGKRRTFICRKNAGGATCPLCGRQDVTRREQGYGAAVVRNPVYAWTLPDGTTQDIVAGSPAPDGAKRTLIRVDDLLREVDVDGTPKMAPLVGVVRQSSTNFWIHVHAIYNRYGPLPHHDLEIKRLGGDKNTQYTVFDLVREDPIEGYADRFVNYMPDLEGMLNRLGSEEYYANNLGTPAPAGEEAQPQSAPQHSVPSGGPVGEQSEFERLQQLQAQAQAEASTTAQQPAAAGAYS